jgi:MFS family permease
LFLFSFAFIAVSYIGLSAVREPEGPASDQPRSHLRVFLKKSVRLLREDRNFGRFILTQLAIGFGAFSMPFYVLYGKNQLQMAAEQVGILVGSQMAGDILSNLLWAQLSDRVGNRIVIILTAAIAALIPLLALLSGVVGWRLLIALFVLIGFSTSGGGIGFTNYLLEIAPEHLRPTYIALHGTLLGLTMVLPILGGLVIDMSSYQAAFIITLMVLIVAVSLSLTLKPVRTMNK